MTQSLTQKKQGINKKQLRNWYKKTWFGNFAKIKSFKQPCFYINFAQM